SYEVAITPSINATTSTNSLKVPYGSSKTFTITPNAGYYLTGITCSSGYTCTGYSTGSASNPSAASRGTQTITVTNNSSTNTGAVSFTLGNTYRISFTKTNISSPSASYVDVAYGGSTTVTVTPSSGYYLSGFSGCPSGWTCSGVSTGTSYTGNQTLTLTNNSSVNTGTITLTGTVADPCAAYGSDYVYLADGHCWTKSSQGTSNWLNASCPSGTTMPSKSAFETLISKYGSGSGLYNATGWSGSYWSSSADFVEIKEGGVDFGYREEAYYLNINSSSANIYKNTYAYQCMCKDGNCSESSSGYYKIVCYR
ncbi:hypothetical protein IJH02_01795, partial [Candidatus Saccharibacteria bacterium]|nr:hypothetical protein [Candidatus Saccharibacteria bacterium]